MSNMLKMIQKDQRLTREDAVNAVRTLLQWIGEDVQREGLLHTPERVISAYEEYFKGYGQDPEKILQVNFSEIAGYSGLVTLKDIRFSSHCEHHMSPIIGVAHVAYLPNSKVVGISKIARIVELFSKRLQIQERMTMEIAQVIFRQLNPKGVAVVIEAEHHCMTTRGVSNYLSKVCTESFLGCMHPGESMINNFLHSVKSH